MYIAASQGQTTPGDKIVMSTETSCHFGHLLQVQKLSLKSHFIHFFFRDFVHVYSPGTNSDNPLGTKFWCQHEHLVTAVICCKFQKNLFEVWFLYMYIAPGQEQTAPSFNVNRNVLSLHSFVASLKKKCLWSLILYHFFHDLIHVYSPGAGANSPKGAKFWCQQKGLILYLFVAHFKEIALKSDFIQFFRLFNTCTRAVRKVRRHGLFSFFPLYFSDKFDILQ